MATPIWDILLFICRRHPESTNLADGLEVSALARIARERSVADHLPSSIFSGWEEKGSVRVYQERAEALCDMWRHLNPAVKPEWFRLDTVRQFSDVWESSFAAADGAAKTKFKSSFANKPMLAYQIIRLGFEGTGFLVFEVLKTETIKQERRFTIYSPRRVDAADFDVGHREITRYRGTDFDVGDAIILIGTSDGEQEPERPRGLILGRERPNEFFNTFRFGLTVGCSPFTGEPVATRAIVIQEDLAILDDIEDDNSRISFGLEDKIADLYPDFADLITNFIKNIGQDEGILTLSTNDLNILFGRRRAET